MVVVAAAMDVQALLTRGCTNKESVLVAFCLTPPVPLHGLACEARDVTPPKCNSLRNKRKWDRPLTRTELAARTLECTCVCVCVCVRVCVRVVCVCVCARVYCAWIIFSRPLKACPPVLSHGNSRDAWNNVG
mmetsp:Transcript_26597/g.68513  ORF Transcript_26597/g.68513 Transcript_26597/m.68513 type:complete len:132 (-) Transcript_26597:109-504(-)